MFGVSQSIKEENSFNCSKPISNLYKCNNCNFRADLRILVKKHVCGAPSDFNDRLIKCHRCDFRTYSPLVLLKHKRYCLKKRKKYSCGQCSYTSGKKLRLEKHKTLKHTESKYEKTIVNGDNWYKCDQCPFQSKFLWAINAHTSEHVNPKTTVVWYECDKCTFITKKKASLKQHDFIEHFAWLKCNECSFETRYKCNLDKHLNRIHGSNKKRPHADNWFKCDHCPFQTKVTSAYNAHAIEHISANSEILPSDKNTYIAQNDSAVDNPDIFKCGYCYYETRNKKILDKHISKIHSIDRNIDGECDEKFETQHLQEHREVAPKRLNWYHCEHCQYKTTCTTELQEHVSCKHPSDNNWLQCNECDFKCKLNTRLWHHKKKKHMPNEIHNLNECDKCSYKTYTKSMLNTHIRKRHALLQCDKCDYQSFKKPDLNRHQLVKHSSTKAKIYECQHCPLKTMWRSSFTKHVNRKHRGVNFMFSSF